MTEPYLVIENKLRLSKKLTDYRKEASEDDYVNALRWCVRFYDPVKLALAIKTTFPDGDELIKKVWPK